jgi:hypothetical protein
MMWGRDGEQTRFWCAPKGDFGTLLQFLMLEGSVHFIVGDEICKELFRFTGKLMKMMKNVWTKQKQ